MQSPSHYFKNAKKLIEEKDPSTLRHAALELRFCIEAITYEKMDFLKDHLPPTIKNTWQADKFFRLLERLEPGSTSDCSIAIGVETSPGLPAQHLVSIGDHKALKPKWLSENYSRLGRYLHVQGKDVSEVKLLEDLTKILEELDKVISSTITNVSFANRISLNCDKCGEKIPVNEKAIDDPLRQIAPLTELECLNESCGIFNVVNYDKMGKPLSLSMTQYFFECDCKSPLSLPKEKLKIEQRFKCLKCGIKYQLTAFRAEIVP